jgi:fibronectin-binding autotransporter adhesin
MNVEQHARSWIRGGSLRFVAAGCVLALSATASAQNLYWDGNGTTAGAGNTTALLNRTWGTFAAWNDDPTGGAGTFSTATANTNDLYFVAGPSATSGNVAYVVTVSGAQVANSLNFQASGGTTISGGTSITLGDGTPGSGGITRPQFAFGSTAQGSVAISTAIILNNSQTWTNNATANMGLTGGVNLNGSALTMSGTGNTGFDNTANIISGAGGITFNGTARLTLGGGGTIPAHTYSGDTNLNGGVTMFSGNTGNLSPNSNININGGILESYWTGGLTRVLGSGANQLRITGGESGFSMNGANGATFNLGASVTWGSTDFNPTKFVLQSAASQNNSSVTFSTAINLSGADRTVIANSGAVGTATSTLSGNITNSTGTAGLIKEGAGLLNLSGTNTYNGGTTISAGTLAFGSIASMPSSGAVAVSSGAALGIELGSAGDWTTGTSGVGTLGGLLAGLGGAGSSTVSYAGDVGLRLNVAATSTYGGVIANPSGSTSLALTKVGNSALTLSNTNTYTGGTNVAVGQLTLGHATDTLPNAGAVTINGGTLALGANSDTVGAVTLVSGTMSSTTGVLTASSVNAQSGTISARLGGSGTLTKSTSGAIVLSGNNNLNFTGDVFLNGGTVNGMGAGTYQGFGTGLVTVNNITFSTNAAPIIANDIRFNPGGTLIITRPAGATPNFTFTGDVELAGNAIYTSGVSTTSANAVFSGDISQSGGARSLTINGTAFGQSTTLSGNNSFSGGLTLSSATILNINSATALGTGTFTVGAAATLNNTSGSPITLSANNVQAYNSNFSFTGTNDLNMGTGNFTYSGTRTITVNGGKLTIGGNNTGGAQGTVKAGAGTLALLGAASINTGANTINAGVLEVGTISNGSSPSSLGNQTSAAASLVFGAPAATLRYVGSSNTTTNRSFTMSSGVGGGATIESSGNGTLSFDNAVALAYGTAAQTRTLTLGGTNTGNNTFGKVLANNTSGATSLVKAGAGRWVLNQANTYTGGTTVTGGTLVVNNTTGSGTGTGSVIIDALATLGGNGTISGATTIDGFHAPGNSPGIQTFGGGLTYNGTSTLTWELIDNTAATLDRGVDYDGVNVTGGAFQLVTGAEIDLAFGGTVDFLDTFWSTDQEWLVVDLSGGATASDTNLFAIGSITGGANYNPSLGTFGIERKPGSNSADSVYLTWVAVPEPGTVALAAVGLIGLGLAARRRFDRP